MRDAHCTSLTAQGPRLRNDLYCVEWDVKLSLSERFFIISVSVNGRNANNEKSTQRGYANTARWL